MREKNAGVTAINFQLLQQCLKHSSAVRFGIVDPNNLQAVDDDLFVVENGYPDTGQRRKVRSTIMDLLVIAGHKISSGRRTEAGPRFNCSRDVQHGAVEHVPGNKD